MSDKTSYTQFQEFTNRLRVLLNIDYDDLEGIIREDEWQAFRTNPWRWMIHTDTTRAQQVFDLMEERHGHNAMTELLDVINGILSIVDESEGVTGFHLNGDVAPWGEFEWIDTARAVAAEANGGDNVR